MVDGFVVCVIRADPVLDDRLLRGGNIELPIADHVAQKSLQPILGFGIPFGLDTAARFRL